MYLRPGNLFKDFFVEQKNVDVSSRGRIKSGYNKDNALHFLAVLAEATPIELDRFNQRQHPITHTITQKGKPVATAEDRIIHGNRIFFVQGVDEPGELGLWTIYYVEERCGVDGDKS